VRREGEILTSGGRKKGLEGGGLKRGVKGHNSKNAVLNPKKNKTCPRKSHPGGRQLSWNKQKKMWLKTENQDTIRPLTKKGGKRKKEEVGVGGFSKKNWTKGDRRSGGGKGEPREGFVGKE